MWIAIGALTLAAAWSAAGMGLRSSGDIAYAVGASFGASLPWFLALWLGILRGQTKRPFVAALPVIALALVIGTTAGMVAHERDRALTQSMQPAVEAAYMRGERVDRRPGTSGDDGKAEALLRAMLNAQVADAQAFRADIDHLHVEDAFGPALASDPAATRAYELAAEGEQVAVKYRQRYEARADEFKARIAASDISPYVKEDMERSLAAGLASGRPRAEEGFELQQRYMAEFVAAAKVLHAASGGWRIAGGNIQFDDPTAQNNYVAHVRAAQQLAGEIDAYTARARASNAANIDRLSKP
jgi:hypothetical protein